MALACAPLTMLKVRDVDSKRMLLRLERGKGGRYRNALLPADLLAPLREWWTVGRKQGVMHADGWLFPKMHYLKPLSTRQLHRIVVDADGPGADWQDCEACLRILLGGRHIESASAPRTIGACRDHIIHCHHIPVMAPKSITRFAM